MYFAMMIQYEDFQKRFLKCFSSHQGQGMKTQCVPTLFPFGELSADLQFLFLFTSAGPGSMV